MSAVSDREDYGQKVLISRIFLLKCSLSSNWCNRCYIVQNRNLSIFLVYNSSAVFFSFLINAYCCIRYSIYEIVTLLYVNTHCYLRYCTYSQSILYSIILYSRRNNGYLLIFLYVIHKAKRSCQNHRTQ